MYTKLNQSLIIILVLFYLLFNMYIGKYYNIIIFILMFFGLNNFIKDKITILIAIYIIIITASIIKHFHLLENFETKTKNIPPNKIEKKINKTRVGKDHRGLIDELSDSLIMKYVEKTKQNNPTKISTRKVKLGDLIPTKSELSSSKIKGISSNKKELNQPLVITNDNFIIDGHHRWYINKSKLKSGSVDENNDLEFITCIIINSSINKFLDSILQFKQDYNSKTLDKFKIDSNKIKETKNSIDTIKKHLSIIEKYNNELNKLNIV